MRPLRKNVLVAQMKAEKETTGGIILTTPEASKIGQVLAIGNEVTMLKVADKVIPDWSKGKTTTYEGVQCIVISEDDIWGVVEDE